MKKLFVLMVLGALAVPALAQTAPEEVRVRGYQLEAPASMYVPSDAEFAEVRGRYQLSDGRSMVLSQFGRHMYAAIGQGEPKRILAAGDDTLMATDRSLKVTLQRDQRDEFWGDIVLTVPSDSLAGFTEIHSVRVASR